MTRPLVPALAAALLLLVPATGHAQLGKLLNKGKKAATDQAGAAVAAEMPRRTVDALPGNLTAAELDQATRGLEAEMAAAPKARAEADRRNAQLESERKAYEKARADYEKKREQWDKCRDKIDNDPKLAAQRAEAERKTKAIQDEAEREFSAEEMEALARRVQPSMERMQAGTATEADRKAIAEFQAKMAKAQALGTDAMSQVEQGQRQAKEVEARYKACGAEPEAPKSPDATGASAEQVMQEAGAKAAEMEQARYALVREYAIMSTTLQVNTKGRSQAEADAINGRIVGLIDLTKRARAAGVPL
jgi:chromosome segregation ATPase